ncbi:hypothetical protein PG984_013312 [Apiospora sp. TS-2023a]
MRAAIAVVIHRDHTSLKDMGVNMGVNMEDDEWSVMGFYVLTDFWVTFMDKTKRLMGKFERIQRSSGPSGDDDADIYQLVSGYSFNPTRTVFLKTSKN